MKVLGLDLSLRATGGCTISGDRNNILDIKTFLLKRESVKGVQASVERLISIANDITDMITKESITIVVIEAPAQNQKWQAAAIGELHGVVKTQIFSKTGIVPYVEQATKLRKAVVGEINSKRRKVVDKSGKFVNKVDYGLISGKRKGTTKKATVKDIVEQRLNDRGLTFPSQDEMDAYVAARYIWDYLKQN